MKRLILLALLLASPAIAGDCHIAPSVPVVTDWSIAAKPGGIVVDAKLAGASPSETYRCGECDGLWWHYIYVRPEGSTGFYDGIDMLAATVTDSTFHFETPWPAGTYTYIAAVGGTDGDPQECSYAYEFTGTLTITDQTPVRRASWGAAKARWR